MDFNKDYYAALGIAKSATEKEIKKAYYKLSFDCHPDKGGNPLIFGEITEAYDILTGENRSKYDTRSKWGASYDESSELLEYEFNNNAKFWDEEKFESWKEKNQLNVLVYIDEFFNGTIQYERWVMCKECGGDGKDTTSKIQIKDENGNVLKLFDGADGCDFCEGSGKSWKGDACYFCGGKGKVGYTDCKKCGGEKRILGKQKLIKIKFPKNQKAHRVQAMGHFSPIEIGKVGDLWLIRN